MTTKHSPPRDSIAVIYAVLNFLVGKDSESQTSVLYAGNMSYAHQQRLRDRLEKLGMVIVDRQTKRWAITNKGVALRDAINMKWPAVSHSPRTAGRDWTYGLVITYSTKGKTAVECCLAVSRLRHP